MTERLPRPSEPLGGHIARLFARHEITNRRVDRIVVLFRAAVNLLIRPLSQVPIRLAHTRITPSRSRWARRSARGSALDYSVASSDSSNCSR